MNVTECIKNRKSIREFKNKTITEEKLREIIDTTRYYPSWKNAQIVRFVVVDNKDLKAKIATECTDVFPSNGKIIKGADKLVAITAIKKRSGYTREGEPQTPRGNGWQMFDAGIATQTFCLAAYEEGIGSVVLGLFDENKVGEYINISEDRELIALVAIGYPDIDPPKRPRKEVDEILEII